MFRMSLGWGVGVGIKIFCIEWDDICMIKLLVCYLFVLSIVLGWVKRVIIDKIFI